MDLQDNEDEPVDNLFQFPHFLLSLSRTIDKVVTALKVIHLILVIHVLFLFMCVSRVAQSGLWTSCFRCTPPRCRVLSENSSHSIPTRSRMNSTQPNREYNRDLYFLFPFFFIHLLVQAASIRPFTGFLNTIALEVRRLWILTATIFSLHGPEGTTLARMPT